MIESTPMTNDKDLSEWWRRQQHTPPRPEPDCRTCANHVACVNTYPERQTCVSGDKYQPLPPVRLWRTP